MNAITKIAIFVNILSYTCLQSSAFSFPVASGASTLGKKIYVQSCKAVVAHFRGHSGVKNNIVYLSQDFSGSPGRDGSTANDLQIFDSSSNAEGDILVLGVYPENTLLELRLRVQDTGNDFYTGSATVNPDNKVHARVQNAWIPFTTLISMEDDLASFSYDDISVSLENTANLKMNETCLSPDP